MKKITLRRPLIFLQIFANIWDIPKDQRNNNKVKDIRTLPRGIVSETGYFDEGILFLSDSLREQKEKIISSGFVVITDHLRSRFVGMTDFSLFTNVKHPCQVSIFTVQMNEEKLSLSLNYSDNRSVIGDPARDDFRFGEVKRGESLRFTLNSKNDSHDQRKYFWFDYLFMGYENVNEIVFDSASNLRISKQIPQAADKEVSLLKDIY
ncbi:MAG: hypothetical protein IT279_02310 [Ignavibacteriaceae bacterium]|nr:hypothetical protein [Ignavibacteriaceae bacterium]